MSDLDTKLAEIAGQYDDVQAELSKPEVVADPNEIRRLGRELSRLEPVVEAFRRLNDTRQELHGARELRDAHDGDDEMRAMAREEIARLEGDETRLLEDSRSSCCRATPTTTATSSSRSGPAPAGRRQRSSAQDCCGCTCATPLATSTRPRS